MDDVDTYDLPWLAELTEQVREALNNSALHRHENRPALASELDSLRQNCEGWSKSLANPTLRPEIREAIELEWAAATDRIHEIERILSEQIHQASLVNQLIDPSEILQRLNRLADILADYGPTVGNLELSLHIDRINCAEDGTITMRTCKLGALTGAVDLLSTEDPESPPARDDEQSAKSASPRQTGPRRRGRLRVAEIDDERGTDPRALTDFVADPNRFSGLDEDWFWHDSFQVPKRPPSWVATNAEAVFRRRRESRLSLAKLADEFGVSRPTVRAAIKAYLANHPEVKDEVDLPRGGARPIKFHVDTFAGEARQLWESGWSKLKLAEKYGCSTPVIDKALKLAYEWDGRPMPTRKDMQKALSVRVRAMLESGQSLDDIAGAMQISDVTARKYLKASFAAEGKSMPDLRTGRGSR